MKKKILFTLLLATLLVCIFAIGVSAATVYKKADGTVLFTGVDENGDRIFESYTGAFPNYDAQGNALTWYITATESITDTVHTVDSFVTVDTTGTHASLSDSGVYKYVNQARELSIVSVCFPDDSNILTISLSDDGYGSTYDYSTDKSNILFATLPNTLTELPKRFGQATPIIDCTIPDEAPITSFSAVCFYRAKNLRSVDIPSNVTIIYSHGHVNDGHTFYDCVSLVDVDFAENSKLETIQINAFNSCKALKEITIPNSVVNLGERAFQDCSSLETIRLGANAGRGLTEYNVQSMLYFCKSLKYVYMSDTMVPTKGSHLFNDGASGMVIFYTGDFDEYESLYATLKSLGNNGKFTGATAVEWDSSKDDQYYKDMAATEKKNYVVYGYNSCKAFYESNHDFGDTTYSFTDEKYLSSYSATGVCENCQSEVVEEICAPLFVNKGYAKEEGGSFFTYGFVADKDEIAKYEEVTGEKVSYGIIAAKKSLSASGALIDANGVAIEGAIAADFTAMDYTIYNVKITGIGEADKASDIYCSAYVFDGGVASYIGNTVSSTSVLISYDKIEAITDEE